MKRVMIVVIALVLLILPGATLAKPPAEVPSLSSTLHLLPPLGDAQGKSDRFDQSLIDFLTVTICRVEGSGCATVQEYTSQKDKRGLDYIKLQNHQYHFNWDVDKNQAGKEFEIHFAVAGLEIGSVSYTPGKGKTVPVKFCIDNHPRIRCRVLHEQGYSAPEIAEVVRDEFGLGAQETAQILADDGFPASEVGLALKEVFDLDATGVAQILKDIYNLNAHTTAQILKDLNFSAVEVGTALRDVFSLDASGAAQILKDVGFSVVEVGTALRDVFSLDASGAAQILKDVGFSAVEVGTTLRDVFGLDAQATAQILKDVGFSATEVSTTLRDVFGLDAQATAQILANVGYSLGDIYGVLTNVFEITDVFEIERILETIGFLPEEYLEYTARASVEKFAPVLKFNRPTWYLPMSAERWFDEMLCGGNGPPFENGGYNYWACASWDTQSYDSPNMPYDRWVWGNPPPVGGRAWFMYVLPVQALVNVPDIEDGPSWEYWWGTNGPQGGPNVPTYFKVEKNSTTGALRIRYSWFYSHQSPCEWSANFDAFPPHHNGEHIGDWEHVIITTKPDRSGIEAVTYSQHGGLYTRWSSVPGSYQTEFGGYTVQSQRPVVYVGMLSHGNYHDSTDIPFFPYFAEACKYFNDQREPASVDDWWFTDANLVSLRRGEESWMKALATPLPPGATDRWAWGPAVKECSINLGAFFIPAFPPLGVCFKHRWGPVISGGPTEWEPCFNSCGKQGCEKDQWSLATQEERNNWDAWCPGSPSTLTGSDLLRTDVRLDAQLTSGACDPTSSDCGQSSTDLENIVEVLYRMAAQTAGMSVEELKAAIADGKLPTLCEYAEAQGRDVADVWAETETPRQLTLQKAVEEGELTQAQAEWISELLAGLDPVEICAQTRGSQTYLPIIFKN